MNATTSETEIFTEEIPKLTEQEMEKEELIICERGIEFHFRKGFLIAAYPYC